MTSSHFGFKKYIYEKNKSLYLSASVFSTAVLIGDTVKKETNIVVQQKLVKNPNWNETDQLAITKHAGVKFGATKDKSSSGREKNLNDLGPPVYKSSALTTRPRWPLYFLKHKDRFLRKNRVQSPEDCCGTQYDRRFFDLEYRHACL